MCEIEDFWKSDNEDKNKEIFFKYTQYTKENNEEKISLFIPDYFGYTNKLYNLFKNTESVYMRICAHFIGFFKICINGKKWSLLV